MSRIYRTIPYISSALILVILTLPSKADDVNQQVFWHTNTIPINKKIEFGVSSCNEEVFLEVGKYYRLHVNNHGEDQILDPLPKNFIQSISINTVELGGIKIGMFGFSGVSIYPGSTAAINFVPLTKGIWEIGCSKITVQGEPRRNFSNVSNDLVDYFYKIPIDMEDFQLTDQKAQVFSKQQMMGKWSIVFFGYTSCPDVCPTGLMRIMSAYDGLSTGEQQQSQPIFISVDSKRDTPETLDIYAKSFGNNLVATVGDKINLDLVTENFSADYYLSTKDKSGSYAVSHTANFFLVNPESKIVGRLPHDSSSQLIQKALEEAVRIYNQ